MKKFIVNFKESIAFDIYSSIMVIVKSRFYERSTEMKWEKTYPTGYLHDGRIKYVHGEFSIMKTNDKNWETGRPMSDAYQVWLIRKNGEKLAYGYTLKEAKEIAEDYITYGK